MVHLDILEQVYNWSRKRALRSLFFGLVSCAIDMIASFDPRFVLPLFRTGISSGCLWLHGATVHPLDCATDGGHS